MIGPIPKHAAYPDVPLERAGVFELVPLLLREARSRSLARVEPPRDVHNQRDVVERLSVPQYGRGACVQLEPIAVGKIEDTGSRERT